MILYVLLGVFGFIVFQVGFWFLSKGLAECTGSETVSSTQNKVGGGFGLTFGLIMMGLALFLGMRSGSGTSIKF